MLDAGAGMARGIGIRETAKDAFIKARSAPGEADGH